jgi:alpha-L-fucosidase 2
MNSSIILTSILSCSLAACAADISDPDEQNAEDITEVGVVAQELAAGDTFIFVSENAPELCLGVDRASIYPGAAVKQFPCDRSLNQTWRVSRTVHTSGFRPLVNVKSNLCLGVSGGGTTHGADLMQFACDGRANQQWRPQDRPNATFRFQNANGLCMGVDGGSTASGAQIKQFRCDERKNQRWSVRSN